MAKKRTKNSRKTAAAVTAAAVAAAAVESLATAAATAPVDEDAGSIDPITTATAAALSIPTAPRVSLKDLADASAEDVARASFEAPAAVLSPRHDDLEGETGVEDDVGSDAAAALAAVAAQSFAASAAETVLSWKLARNGAAVSPLLAPAHDGGADELAKQQPTTITAATILEHIPGVQHVGSDHENYVSDDDDDDGPTASRNAPALLVPNIKTYDLDARSSSFLGQYIDDEVQREAFSIHNHARSAARGSQHSLGSLLHAAASPCSSLAGGSQATLIPHTKSLIMDELNATVVLQAMPSTKSEVVEVVAEQSWLITKLTVQLLWALRMSRRWMLCVLRLVLFVVLLLPPLLRMLVYFFVDAHIHKNLIYGLNGRNLLDVYTVPGSTPPTGDVTGNAPVNNSKNIDNDNIDNDNIDNPTTKTPAAAKKDAYPVVVFFTGGAWIIGYKAWGALIGKVLSSFGIVVVTPDYRNFPQGIVPDMVDDATRAMQWVFDNIHLFGGDPENVTVVGQSAGAHIAVCALLELVEKQELALRRGGNGPSSINSSHAGAVAMAPSPTFSACSRASSVASVGGTTECRFAAAPTWSLSHVRSFIGISGPYNIEVAVETFHRHGFDKTVVERIMAHKLAYYSPALRLLAKSEQPDVARQLATFPPVFLFHGTNDKTVSWRSSEQFAAALEACGVPVRVRYFDGKSHTDPILEDPIRGDDFLLDEIRRIITQNAPRDATTGAAKTYELGALSPSKRSYPRMLVQAARKMNPF